MSLEGLFIQERASPENEMSTTKVAAKDLFIPIRIIRAHEDEEGVKVYIRSPQTIKDVMAATKGYFIGEGLIEEKQEKDAKKFSKYTTIEQVKYEIELITGIAMEKIRLIYRGEEKENTERLEDNISERDIQDQIKFQMVRLKEWQQFSRKLGPWQDSWTDYLAILSFLICMGISFIVTLYKQLSPSSKEKQSTPVKSSRTNRNLTSFFDDTNAL